MTFDAAVVTACYDSYDIVEPICPQDGPAVDWVCVTDNDDLVAPGWRIIYEPRLGVHPNVAAKRPKMLPWEYTDAPASVWIDAAYTVVSASFVTDVLVVADPIAQFVHPWRDCAYDEAEFSATLDKYDGLDLVRQAAHYRDQLGFPAHWGLWATGVIARWHQPPQVRAFGRCWLAECESQSYQDQVSEPPALWLCALRPSPLPGSHLANDWLVHHPSGRH